MKVLSSTFRTVILIAVLMNSVSKEAMASIMLSYYVSTSGNDSWPGTELQPFKTIQRARDAVRAITGTWTGDVYVWIRGGTYTLTGTLEFTEVDSGKDGH